MQGVSVADVGHGLSVEVLAGSDGPLQIDCGSQERDGPRVAFEHSARAHGDFPWPTCTFALSHFHADHYNGLFHAASIRQPYGPLFSRLSRVYFPRIPEFPQREQFALAFDVLNRLVLGDTQTPMQQHLVSLFQKMTFGTVAYAAACEGHHVEVEGYRFTVVWPPRRLTDERPLKAVREAIEAFDRAVEADEGARRMRDTVREHEAHRHYFGGGEDDTFVVEGTWRPPSESDGLADERPRGSDVQRELPEVVQVANDALRKAANHLSLCFYGDDRFLFLGDLERREIPSVVEKLRARKRTHFEFMVTPHHGTHWHDSLGCIRFLTALTSNGAESAPHLRPEFKERAKRSMATYCCGDFRLVCRSALRAHRRWPWYDVPYWW